MRFNFDTVTAVYKARFADNNIMIAWTLRLQNKTKLYYEEYCKVYVIKREHFFFKVKLCNFRFFTLKVCMY